MTAKLVLDTRYTRKDNLFPICIRLRSGKQMKHISCGHYVPEKAWGKGEVKRNFRDADIINSDILKQLAEITTSIRLARSQGITDLSALTESKKKEVEPARVLFSDYIENRAKQYDAETKIKHARKVRRLLCNLRECFGKLDIPFDLTTDDLRTFNAYLKNIPNDVNTIAHKFSKLNQLFSNAIKERKTLAENPFDNFNVPRKPAHREKLTQEEITAIETLVLPKGIINDSRNIFLFSYYCKGMRFEDCLRIKRKDIIKDRIIFKEIRKGHRTITVQLHSKLKQLIEPYMNNTTPYLFPLLKQELIIDKTGQLTQESERERISKVEPQNTIVNRNLKVIAAAAGIYKEVSCHVARHSFAYNMKKQGSKVSVIQDALGHGSQAITEHYLKALDDEAIDLEVNKLYE